MRTVCLIGRDSIGSFFNPITGERLSNVADGNNVDKLIDAYKAIRASGDGIIRKGKTEVKLSEVLCLANNTSGGELKAKLRFKPEVMV